MRAAIVGAGFVGGVHAGALAQLRVELVGTWGRHDDLGAMLDAERPDVLHVCTPNALHAAQALAALDRGINVICEKLLIPFSYDAPSVLDRPFIIPAISS